jgi:hypothetical protein
MPGSRSTLITLAGLIAFHGTALPQGVSEPQMGLGLCGSLENSYGPFDYRTIPPGPRHLVESAHFPPKVEALRAGSRGYIGGDIDYTLRAIPNHHRALMAMVRLGERTGRTQPTGATFPIECYFDRAERFARDDPMVHVLYGIYLARAQRITEATAQLGLAEQLGGNDPQVVYNLGIGHLELKNYDRSVEFAEKAAALGIHFPGLRQRLERAGKWPN